MKRFLKISLNSLSIIIVVATLLMAGYIIKIFSTTPDPQLSKFKNADFTTILDEDLSVVEIMGKDKKEYVYYNDIPSMLVNALISIEDANFFSHEGIDYRRTIQALMYNLQTGSTHGASTITQQLVKNAILSPEQTYERKLKEAYLAYQLEKHLTKEEILEHYFNSVYFEQSIPGVVYASRKYFNKELNQLSIPECAILAAVVKSASYYNPLKYPERVDSRKNQVINRLSELGYISDGEKTASLLTKTESLVVDPNDIKNETNYRFQAYLDVVYLEATELTGLDPFVDKLEIHTYLDTSLQSYLDAIQQGTIISYTDDEQQVASTVIRNEDNAIRGVIGGRNYNGSRIFNRAYSMKRQPASTIKPIFSYLLAAEHLGFNSATTVIDEPYTYPGSNFTVQNADKKYSGNISVLDALGYSKNTSALHTLEKVSKKIGNTGLVDHLNQIGIMDDGIFNYSYGIGGMSYGISPTQLAGAYTVLANNGEYLKPSTISLIKRKDTGEVIYSRNMKSKSIVSKESAFIIAETLIQMVDKNYFGIGAVAVNDVQIGAKTGTNGFDKNAAKSLNYPEFADKDTWVAGFSKDYSVAVWTGFDISEKDRPHYFGKNDIRRKIPKEVFTKIMNRIALKDLSIVTPSTLSKVNVVSGTNGTYIPNPLIPNGYIIGAYYPNESIPNQVLPLPKHKTISDVKVLITDYDITLDILVDGEIAEPFDYQKIFGKRGYLISLMNSLGEVTTVFSETEKITLDIDFTFLSSIIIEPTFANKNEQSGVPYILTFE